MDQSRSASARQRSLLPAFESAEREFAYRSALLQALPVHATVRRVLAAIYQSTTEAKGVTARVSITSIARAVILSDKTVRRAVQKAEDAGWLTVTRVFTESSLYVIEWTTIFREVGSLVRVQTEQKGTPSVGGGGLPSREGGDSHRGRGGTPIVGDPYPLRKEDFYRSSDPKGFQGNADSGNGTAVISVKRSAGGSSWPVAITKPQLLDAAFVEVLWQHALSKGWVRETDMERLGFFAAAVQSSGKKVTSPGGCLTYLVKRKAWNDVKGITGASEEIARGMLRRLQTHHTENVECRVLQS